MKDISIILVLHYLYEVDFGQQTNQFLEQFNLIQLSSLRLSLIFYSTVVCYSFVK